MNQLKLILKNKWFRLFIKVAFSILIIWLIFGVFFGIARVEGYSMSNNLKDGDLIFFSRFNEEYNNDDVIIYKDGDKTKIARIIAKSGDLVSYDEDGHIKINNNQYSQDIMLDMTNEDEAKYAVDYRVPENSYFVLNDNIDDIDDSRKSGSVSESNVIGIIISFLRTRSI